MLLTEYDEEETLKVVAEDARAEGEAIGEDRLASLVSSMVQSGADQETIMKASTDPAYRKAMYARYHIDL